MRVITIIVTFSVVFNVIQSNAQKTSSWGFGTNFHYGFMAAHHDDMGHLANAHLAGAEVFLYKQTNGTALWQQLYRYPKAGLSLLYIDLPNDSISGDAFGLMSFVDMPVFRGGRYYFSIRSSVGLAYLTRHFQRIDNYKNNAIGSAMNAAIQFNFQNTFRISERLEYRLNVGFVHFSNASFSTPNLGINIFTLNTGISYLLTVPDTFYKSSLPVYDPGLYYEVILAGGVKEIYPPDGEKYFESTLMMNALKQISQKSKLGGGFDVFYDPVLITKMELDQKSTENVIPVRAGIHGEYQMLLGKLSLLFDVGFYVIDPMKGDGYLYNRVGLRYCLTPRLVANITLKSHYAKAEYAEWGVGYKFGNFK